MFIRSERLFLRPGWSEDVDELTELLHGEAVVSNIAGLQDPKSVPPAAVHDYICRPRQQLLPHFVITLPCSRGARLIGGIGLTRDESNAVELDYWISRDPAGADYAAEAARAVLSLARALGHRRIVASQWLGDSATGAMLASAGFQPSNESAARFSPLHGTKVPVVIHVAELGGLRVGDNDPHRTGETETRAA